MRKFEYRIRDFVSGKLLASGIGSKNEADMRLLELEKEYPTRRLLMSIK